ncbi:MAG TPA: copper chaperone PCu(A)C [Sedimenticola sp.]|nr:copper chaperone PCu(A)C [Sedimenticola sp.]
MKIQAMVLTGILGLAAAGALYAGTAADDVEVSGAYARAVPPGQPNSAAFLTLSNKSGTDHRLVDAASPAAKVVELHTHINDNGMMKMRRVNGIDVPAGKVTKLQPGGYHVMLIGLTRDLKPGEAVELTLLFNDGSEIRTAAPVQKLQMKMMKHDSGAMQHQGGKMMMK